ncbi:cytochrome c oxidase assembly protein [Roseovarius sp. S1116L3]|uniref:cytochrome c oxidase assembly protein n=1 Tax=Roseovarius roseus TaxID=3342636 RepID=UPI003728CDE7
MDGIYCGAPPPPADLWASWNLDPVLIAALAVLTVVLRHKPTGLAAVAVMVLAFVSPLCALSSALFSARVVHHVLLVAVAAPLLAFTFRARAAGGIALPFVASTLVLWGWHHPLSYDAALSNMGVYWMMQLSLLGTAIWFWWAVFTAEHAPIDRLFFVIGGFAQMGMLGAILTFAPSPLFAAHAFAPFEWGLTPLRDQQLGGLIMWVPAGIPYALAAAMMARRSWGQLTGRAAC